MSRGHFTIHSTTQEITVNTDQISGHGGADSPTILVSVKIDFCPVGRGHRDEMIQFEVLSLRAELRATDKNFKIAETTLQTSYRVYDKNSYSTTFQFLVNESIINKIEKARKENLPMNITISAQVGMFESVSYVNKQGEKSDRLFITGFDTGQGNVAFQVEQSQWVNKVLPQMGHGSYKLIELPAINQIIPEEYKISLGEFEEARKYFLNGDYDKTVAHCRAALDPFSGKTNLPKLKEFVKSKSEFAWATSVLESTEEWLEKVIKATSSFTSKTHHAPSIGHFSRTEAEIVLMITTGIIAYIGKIEYKAE